MISDCGCIISYPPPHPKLFMSCVDLLLNDLECLYHMVDKVVV